MKRIKAYTIEEEMINWVEQEAGKRGASSFINELIIQAKRKVNNIPIIYQELEDKKQEIEKEQAKLLFQAEKQLKDGDKKEREEAEKVLKLEKEQAESKKRSLELLSCMLKDKGYLDNLLKCKTIQEIFAIEKKLQAEKFTMPHATHPGIGFVILKDIIDFNGGNFLALMQDN